MEDANGLRLTFLADLAQVRADVQQFAQETAAKPIVVQVRAAGAVGSGRGAMGSLMGADPAGMVAEDRRIEQRLLTSGESSARVERLIDRTGGGVTPVIARRMIDIPGVPATWGNYAGWGGGAGAPPWLPGGGYGGGGGFGGGAGGGGYGGDAGFGGGGGGGGYPPMGDVNDWGMPSNGPRRGPLLLPGTVFPPDAAQRPGAWDWARGGGGGGGMSGLSFLALRRMAHMIGSQVQELQKYNEGTILAAGDQAKQFKVDEAAAESRFFGLSSFTEDPTGEYRGWTKRIAAGAEATDAHTAAVLSGAKFRAGEGYQFGAVTAASDYERRKIEIERKYDPLLNDAALRNRDKLLETSREQEKGEEAAIRSRYDRKRDDAFSVTFTPGQEAARDAREAKIDSERDGEIAAMRKTQQEQRAKYQADYEASIARDKTAKAAEIAANQRDRDALLYGLRGSVAVSGLEGSGFEDAAAGAALANRHRVEELRINPADAELLNATKAANAGEESVLNAKLARAGFLRRDQYGAEAVAGVAGGFGNDVPGQMAKLFASARAGIVNAQTQDLPWAVLAAGANLFNGIAAIDRREAGSMIESRGAVTASGFLARGETAEARKAQINTRLQEELNANGGADAGADARLRDLKGPGFDDLRERRANARATAANDIAAVDREEARSTQRLRDEVNETAALAQGNERGGMRETFQARQLIDRVKEAADAEPDPQKRALILQAGVNRATAERRDLLSGGGPEEVSPGTLGPGFAGEGGEDTKEAIRELNENLKALNANLAASNLLNSDAEQIAASFPF